MAGVQEIKELVGAIAEGGSAAAKIMADGQVSLSDLRHGPALLKAIKGLSGVDYKSLLPEVKDLSDEERVEIHALFCAAFVMPEGMPAEEVIEQGMEMLLMALQAVASMMDVFAKVKAPEVAA